MCTGFNIWSCLNPFCASVSCLLFSLSIWEVSFFCLCLYLFSPVLFFLVYFVNVASPIFLNLVLLHQQIINSSCLHTLKRIIDHPLSYSLSFYFRVFIKAGFCLFRVITLFRLTVMMPQSPKNAHFREMTGSPTLMIRRKSSFSSYRAQLERCCHLSNF